MGTLRTCVSVVLLLNLFIASIISQVVSYSQNEDSEEETIARLMELDGLLSLSSDNLEKPQQKQITSPEQFEHLSHFPNNRPQRKDDYSNMSQNMNTPSSSSDGNTHSLLHNGIGESDLIDRLDAKLAKEEELGAIDEIDGWKEFLLPFEEDTLDHPLHRSKRDLVAGSGQTLIQGFISLDGSLTASEGTAGTPENNNIRTDIAEGIRQTVSNVHPDSSPEVEVTSVRDGSIIASFDIVFTTEELTLQQLAVVFRDLVESDNLKLPSTTYAVDHIYLEDQGTDENVVCLTCEAFQTCVNTTVDNHACFVNDARYFAFGPSEGDSALPKNSEHSSALFQIPTSFPFQEELLKKVYVYANGYFSFENEYQRYSPLNLPVSGQRILAPYWTDLDLISSDLLSSVYYKMHVKTDSNNAMETEIFRKANEYIVTYIDDVTTYDATHVIKVTWESVPPWRANLNLDERVNFQAVIVTDGQSSYAIFIYPSGGMNFKPASSRRVTVGWGSSNFDNLANYYTFDSVVGDTNTVGLWVFKIGAKENTNALCLNFFRQNDQFLAFVSRLNFRVRSCPCSEIGAFLDNLWIFDARDLPQRCYNIFPLFGSAGRKCCYRNGALDNRIGSAGSFQLISPFVSLALHTFWDSNPKQYCCANDSPLCGGYYVYRPQRQCTSSRRRRSWFWGDPHIQTLDGREYTFNGIGEYTLLEIVGKRPDDVTVNFKLQGRTCRALTVQGNATDASNWCALAGMNTNGTTFRVSIAPTGNYLEIYINDEDFSSRFRVNPDFQQIAGGISLRRVNESLSIYTPDDVGVRLTLAQQLIDFAFEVDEMYEGMAKGLMGNFNGDKTDEFIFPNGTQLSNFSSDAQIFEFGKAWAITDETSIFRYPSGKTTGSYSDPSFVPIFLDEVEVAVRAEAEQVCGGAANIACIFDFVATKNEALALSTKRGLEVFQENEAELDNQAPVISTADVVLNTTVGQSTSFTINANDPDNEAITYTVVDTPGSEQFNFSEDSGVFTGVLTPRGLEPIQISIAARDPRGLESEVREITIRNCPSCSGNGQCDFVNLRVESTPFYSIASCVCEIGYSGDFCENDKNGCEFEPCPDGTTCSDVAASDEESEGVSYTCSDCPSGYVLSNNNTKCADVDECAANACGSNSDCTNTVGTFICTCNDGYRKSIGQEHTCADINECIENSHECVQNCNNTIGGYNCYCGVGFTESGFLGRNCSRDEAEDPCKGLTNQCEYGCTNESGVAQCFCASGYALGSDGFSCENVDECTQNLCSQTCTDTTGSYSCDCYIGYFLNSDRHSCDECSENMYGVNCMKRCECRGRATNCDNVQGCICKPQWTGEFCTVDVDECQTPNICPEDQNCVNANGTYACVCPTGYEDTYNNGSCYDTDECAAGIAVTNCSQNCRNNPGSFACFCDDGYQYDSSDNTCNDIDECKSKVSGCGQICVNKLGSFNCECNAGFVLSPDRKACFKAEEVCANSNLECDFECTLINEQPACICKLGYNLGVVDNSTCLDIDECSGTNLCSHTCVNNGGSYSCSCPNGMSVNTDLRTCIECDGYHWGENCANECSCNPRGTSECSKISGCICRDGWGGSTCYQDRDECNGNTDVCGDGAQCINTQGSFICQCNEGYQKTAQGACEDVDECDSSPCDQTCSNSIGSYSCSCSSGFTSEGDGCIDIDECIQHRCEQTCRNTFGAFACECEDGFLLNTTTALRNTCYIDPDASKCSGTVTCENCIKRNDVDTCICSSGYTLSSDNTSCININECDNSPCKGNGSACADNEGGFVCACTQSGFKLSEDLLTCTECPENVYGVGCANSCSCNATNTVECTKDAGTCECRGGYNGVDCSTDINECDNGGGNCGDNSNCENTAGSYRCRCNTGFYPAGQACQSCAANSFGEDCFSTCTCQMDNTQDCNDVSGICTCKDGWEGNNCDTDVNECSANSNSCTGDHEKCNNIDGSFDCGCVDGYFKVDGICKDDDECNRGTDNCQSPKVCNNTIGSFDCVCDEGYEDIDGTCTAAIKTYIVNVTFIGFTEATENNLPSSLQTDIAEALFTLGRQRINLALLKIVVLRLFKGSVISETEVYINELQTDTPDTESAKLFNAIASTGSIQVGTQTPSINSVTYNGSTLTSLTSVCDAYDSITDCVGGTECGLVNDSPQCVDKEDDSSDYELKVGLGVGIPLFVLLCIVIAVGVCLYTRKKNTRHSTPSVNRDAPFQTVFATQVATKGSWGAPHRFGMYSPDAYSEVGTSDSSGNGKLLKGRQKVRTDFQDSPWYNNQGFTPRGTPRDPMGGTPRDPMGGTPRDPMGGNGHGNGNGAYNETGAPTSNFSWEYMFRLLEPHRGFEIQRPNLSAAPNPAYTPRSNGGRHPDSNA